MPLPRSYADLRPRDVWFVVGLVGAVIGAMWLRHGGLAQDPLAAIGQLTALGGTYAALLGVLFAARAPWLDQVIGTDRLRWVHGVLGFASVWALAVHGVTSTLAFAGDAIDQVVPTLLSLVRTVPGMLGAIVSLGLFLAVGASSMRAARRRMSYETFHGIHLYVYLAIAFGFLHQLTIGTDFADDPIAVGFWIGLYVIAFAPLVLYRLAWPLLLALRHRPYLRAVVREADDTFSLVVGGRALDRLPVRSGQFFVVRALTRHEWQHGHPFSLSAQPNGETLRFTVKELGEGTRALAALRPGTPLLLEGPYGSMHGGRRTGRKLLLIAGGIGIAPLRAMVEGFGYRSGDLDLIYRTRDHGDAPLQKELEVLAAQRGFNLHVVRGRRGESGVPRDPLAPAAIRRLVPDAADRDVFLCGPDGLMNRAFDALVRLGVSSARINLELFG